MLLPQPFSFHAFALLPGGGGIPPILEPTVRGAGGTVRLAHRQECLCPRANADSTRPRAQAKRTAPFGRLRPSRNGCATG